MKEQKFVHGDLVKIAAKLPSTMRHFESGIDAYIIHSYAEEHGSLLEDDHEYAVVFAGVMEFHAWYPESVLTFKGRISPRKLLRLRIAKEQADFEKEVAEMKKEGMEPDPENGHNFWRRIEE